MKTEHILWARSLVPNPEGDYIPPERYIRPTAGKVIPQELTWSEKKKVIMAQFELGKKFTIANLAAELNSKPKTVHDILSDMKRRGYPLLVIRQHMRANIYCRVDRKDTDTLKSIAVDAFVQRLCDFLKKELPMVLNLQP